MFIILNYKLNGYKFIYEKNSHIAVEQSEINEIVKRAIFPKDINSQSQKLNWIARKSGYSSWNHFKKLVPDKDTFLNDLVEREDIFITIGKKRTEIINSYIETYKSLYGDLAFFFRFEKYPVAYEHNINFLEELFSEEEVLLEKRYFFQINRLFYYLEEDFKEENLENLYMKGWGFFDEVIVVMHNILWKEENRKRLVDFLEDKYWESIPWVKIVSVD